MNTKKMVLTALAVTLLSTGAAYAGPGNNNGNSNGHGARDNGRNTNGAIASELKWRNAAHASDQARLNADPNSAVGILATLVNTTGALDEANAALAAFDETYEGPIPAGSTADAYDALIAAGYDEATYVEGVDLVQDGLLAAYGEAVAYETAKIIFEESLELEALQTAKTDAETAVGIGIGEPDELSAEAVEALWDLLLN
jgi:hypothetical protein